MNFLIRLLISAFIAYGLSTILSGVHIPDFKDALIFALVLAALNAIVKPVLIFLTLPATIITLGLFLFIINACIILLADYLMDGIKIDGFWWALLFSLLLSALSGFAHSLIGKEKEK
ncbi:MAG: phage holin family protein [Sphingobacteriales bacterium]|nr:MAG: phage holin family protein [Sphingobacteriales bacterium]